MQSTLYRSWNSAIARSHPTGRAGRGSASLLAAGAAVALLGWPGDVGAAEVTTAAVSLAPGQVAQLNAVSISNPNLFEDPCLVRLTLCAARCAEAEACGFNDPEQFEISSPDIMPGEAVLLRVPAEEIGLSGRGKRALVRGTLETRCRRASAAAALKVTLEVYDAETGRTAVVLGLAN